MMEKVICLIITTSLLIGCAATPIEYTAQKRFEQTTAQSVIEQVLMEQPDGKRPNRIIFTRDYIGFDYGEVINTKGIATGIAISNSIAIGTDNSESSLIQLKDRLYLNSEITLKVFKRRDYFIVQILREQGRLYLNVVVRSESKAKAFADAIESLKVKGVFD